jgi:deoxyribonuclease-4
MEAGIVRLTGAVNCVAMFLGAHVSAAGGLPEAVREGVALGCEAIQLFTRNQRQWHPRPLPPEETLRFRRAARAAGYRRRAMSHASYLINLAATDPRILRLSRMALLDELERCAALGIPLLCVHPGAHLGAGEERGIARAAASARWALARTRGVRLLFENTAGQGTTLGWRLEQLAELHRLVRSRRVGVCLDTCHLFAAGYDLRTPKAYERTMRAVEETVGIERVRAFHLNDSRHGLSSRRDRHAHIGQGGLGGRAFALLVNDPRWRALPGVLETPKAGGMDRRNLDRLRRMRKGKKRNGNRGERP